MTKPDNTTPHDSSEYDGKVRQTIPFYETMHLETIDMVRAVKPDAACWLDTGCGTGYLIELALPLFPNTQFILADPSQAMLDQAGERLSRVGETRVKALLPVGSEAQVGEKACQAVTAIQSHHYLLPRQREQAIKACFGILEDDGLFITFENIRPSTQRGIDIGLDRWGRFQREGGRSAPVVAAHRERFGTAYFPITVNDHLALLRAVGFQTVELFWFSHMQAGFYAIK